MPIAALTTLALRGLGEGGIVPSPSSAAEALVSGVQPARELLLRLGVRGVAERAAAFAVRVEGPGGLSPRVRDADDAPGARPGRSAWDATSGGAVAEGATDVQVPGVSARGRALLGEMLTDRAVASDPLLFEALALVARRGGSLPSPLLVRALAGPARRREATAAVLGERGRWLAAQNPAWAWALKASARPDAAPSDALPLGAPSAPVAVRMWARAQAMVRVDATAEPGRLRATLHLPSAVDELAAADGLVRAVGGRSAVRGGQLVAGAGARYLREVFARVDPTVWEEAFGLPPAAILGAFVRSELFAEAAAGWASAAQRWGRPEWLDAIWERQLTLSAAGVPVFPVAGAAPHLAGSVVSRRIAQMLELAPGRPDAVLASLPGPWPDEQSERVLAQLRALAAVATGFRVSEPHAAMLGLAAARISPSCFGAALEPWRRPSADAALVGAWGRLLGDFGEAVRRRVVIHEALGE